jgi:regulator of cell morphogenesis and NO signaling
VFIVRYFRNITVESQLRRVAMTLATAKTVRELAVENPAATRIFERFGIDYCCGGNQPLEQACSAAGVSFSEIVNSLEMEEKTARAATQVRDWQTEPLSELIAHIQNTHHKYTREEIVRLSTLIQKVCSVHGKNHRDLCEIQSTFSSLAQELTMHMMKEEMVLFPYIVRMEEAVIQREPVLPPPFGTVANPVAMMEHEHDSAGNALRAIRKASNDFLAPADACVSYQTLYKALATFEADLHQHIHLENNILFPRAIAMEKAH